MELGEESSIEIHRMITVLKEEMRQTYERKLELIETSCAFAKSTATNKHHLERPGRLGVLANLVVLVGYKLVL